MLGDPRERGARPRARGTRRARRGQGGRAKRASDRLRRGAACARRWSPNGADEGPSAASTGCRAQAGGPRPRPLRENAHRPGRARSSRPESRRAGALALGGNRRGDRGGGRADLQRRRGKAPTPRHDPTSSTHHQHNDSSRRLRRSQIDDLAHSTRTVLKRRERICALGGGSQRLLHHRAGTAPLQRVLLRGVAVQLALQLGAAGTRPNVGSDGQLRAATRCLRTQASSPADRDARDEHAPAHPGPIVLKARSRCTDPAAPNRRRRSAIRAPRPPTSSGKQLARVHDPRRVELGLERA